MQFSLSPEPAGVECFLSETSQGDGNVSRKFCNFLEKSDRFKLQDRNFLRQYAHLYSERLMTMRPKLTEAAKNKWGMFRFFLSSLNPVGTSVVIRRVILIFLLSTKSLNL